MKIVVINNYKEGEKAGQALENLKRSSGYHLEMIDYKVPNLITEVQKRDPDILMLTGSNFMLSKPDTRLVFRQEMDLVRQVNLPVFGICFGHQLIGAAYGSRVTDLGQTVKAFKEIKIIVDDPIFEGLPESIIVPESHRQAIDSIPDGFRHLAESSTSRVEAIAHASRPVYGVQFHPERSDERHPHGRAIIQNFVKSVAKS